LLEKIAKMKQIILITCLFLLSYGCAQKQSQQKKKNEPKSNVVWEKVPIENTTERQWEEGWLIVPENRTTAKANTIKLPFILSKVADSLKRDNIPIIIMSGGPGNSSLNMANGIVYTSWGKNRDLIVLEQRGTRYAQPALYCPELDSLRNIGYTGGYTGTAIDSLEMIGVKLCYESLRARNIGLSGYNTLETVEDIEALRQTLKVDQMILYGLSYSCNLMTAYAQTYPQRVHAVLLDSPLPHHVNYEEEAFQNVDSTLINVVKYYSGSKQLYYNWNIYIQSLQDSVMIWKTDSGNYHYTRRELNHVLLNSMSGKESLPQTIVHMQQMIQGDHHEIPIIITDLSAPSGQALGMRFSVWIAEEMPEQNAATVAKKGQEFPWLHNYPVNDVSFTTAKYFPVESMYKHRKWPEGTYNGPALILSGAFDPWTPPWFGPKMLRCLPNAEHLICPESSHLPGFSDWGMEEIAKFMHGL
jgi:pimeloyl-ACP methyl ester carboxylesterase